MNAKHFKNLINELDDTDSVYLEINGVRYDIKLSFQKTNHQKWETMLLKPDYENSLEELTK